MVYHCKSCFRDDKKGAGRPYERGKRPFPAFEQPQFHPRLIPLVFLRLLTPKMVQFNDDPSEIFWIL